jgi:hypothetical protein
MPRKDALHDACKNALIKEGWTITHDPYLLRRGLQTLYIDVGAELPLAAEKEGRKIAVEIKSLLGEKEMPELERALGQYILYRSLLKRKEADRLLFLAVSGPAYREHFNTAEGRDLIVDESLKLLVFDVTLQEIRQWIE